MGEGTKIEWADHTFNPWWGCEKVSPACAHCYAETWAKRTGHKVWGKGGPRRFFGDKHWNEPLKWDRSAAVAGVRRRVFCASMADVFEERVDLDAHRSRLWELIKATPNLIWMLLTKRPENVVLMCPEEVVRRCWIGTTAEDQVRTERRILQLTEIPAAVRFLSCEPLLGPVSLSLGLPSSDGFVASFSGPVHVDDGALQVDWVICGGESGAGARPMHPEWAQSLRDQCAEADVPFFFKQWGEWFPRCQWEDNPELRLPWDWDCDSDSRTVSLDDGNHLHRVGKKKASRLLDGREWNEVPSHD